MASEDDFKPFKSLQELVSSVSYDVEPEDVEPTEDDEEDDDEDE